MFATAQDSLHTLDALAMLFAAAIPFWASLIHFLGLLNDPDVSEDPPLQVAGRLMRRSLCFVHFPIAIALGGRLTANKPALGWIVGATIALLATIVLRKRPELGPDVLRGTVVISMKQAKRIAAEITLPSELVLNWAGIYIPERYSEHHFCVVGSTGGAKTLILRLLLGTIVSHIKPGSDWRCIINDPKRQAMEVLAGMPVECDILLVNPFDARCVAWDPAKDITTRAMAEQLAAIFIPDHSTQNPFWPAAARDLLSIAVEALIFLRPGEWTLADVLHILSKPSRTQSFVEQVPHLRDRIQEHFARRPDTVLDVFYTLLAYLSPFRAVANLMATASRRISIAQWVTESSIIVLGEIPSMHAPMSAINRLLFHCLSDAILSQPDSDVRKTYCLLDELVDMGRLDALPQFLDQGRSKGARAVISFLTYEGLQAVYGDRQGAQIANMPANKCFLRTDSEETAAWMSRTIGDMEVRQWTRSTHPNQGNSLSEQIITKPAVLPSQFMRLPLANRERFYSYCVTPCIGVYGGATRFGKMLLPKGKAENFIPRPDSDQLPPAHLADTDETDGSTLDDLTRMFDQRDFPDLNDDVDVLP
ncbi:MAG: type IV secretion system DNA-binding domain-containing protein [Phycisphaerae bacterium]|nr:type IV secretion system DNA-binding domain-containing protein [Phycisphaerae bacterium]